MSPLNDFILMYDEFQRFESELDTSAFNIVYILPQFIYIFMIELLCKMKDEFIFGVLLSIS